MVSIGIGIQEIQNSFKTPRFEDKIISLGSRILEHLDYCQLFGQIDAFEGAKTYLHLKHELFDLVGSKKRDGYPIFKKLELEQIAAVLSLYAVWTSIYSQTMNDENNFWDPFFCGLGIQRSPQLSERTGNVFKHFLEKYEHLATFPEVQEETSWVHVSPILLHGLPSAHLTRLIETCVLSDPGQRYSTDGQRQQWLLLMEKNMLPVSTVRRFFKYGGTVAQTYTRYLMDLRDAWNEKGEICYDVGLPHYIVNLFEKVVTGQPRFKPQKLTLSPRIKPPVLMLDLDQGYGLFIRIPTQVVTEMNPSVTMTAQGQSPSSQELRTFTYQNKTYTREKDIFVSPAQSYALRIGRNAQIQSIEGDASFLTFDSRTGKRCSLDQDVHWPEQILLILAPDVDYKSEGIVYDKGLLHGTWQHWRYVLLHQPATLEITQNAKTLAKLEEKHTRRKLAIHLEGGAQSPYWVHLSQAGVIVTQLADLEVCLSELPRGFVRLSLRKVGASNPIYRANISQKRIHLPQEHLELETGYYEFRLEAGLDAVEQKFLYLRNASFQRFPINCTTESAQELKFSLPVPFRILGSQQQSSGPQHLCQLNKAAVELELFPDTPEAKLMSLILQDIRWKRYGYGHFPRLNEMRIEPETIAIHQLELPDPRIRIEVETPVIQELQRDQGKVVLQLRDEEGSELVQARDLVKFQRHAYWDLDVVRWAQEAESFKRGKSASLGLMVNKQFFSMFTFALCLQLKNLQIRHLGFRIESAELNELLEISWSPSPEDPPAARLKFWVGALDQPKNAQYFIPPSDGQAKLRVMLPAAGDAEKWELYADASDSLFTRFEPQKSQISWSRQSLKSLLTPMSLISFGFDQSKGVLQELLLLEGSTELADLKAKWYCHPIDEPQALVKANLISLNNGKYQIKLPLTQAKGVWAGYLAIESLVLEPVLKQQWERNNTLQFGELSLQVQSSGTGGDEIEISWSKETAYLRGPIYLFTENLYRQDFNQFSGLAQGNKAKFKLPPVDQLAPWRGYLSLQPSKDNTFSHTETFIGWWRGSGFTILKQAQSCSPLRWNELVQTLHVRGNMFLNESSHFTRFLLIIENGGEKLLRYLGVDGLGACSPFGKGRSWKLYLKQNQHVQPLDKCEVTSDLEDASDNFERFIENGQSSTIWKTLDPNGITEIDVYLKEQKGLSIPKHRVYLKEGNLLQIQPVNAQRRSRQHLQTHPQQTFHIEAELPRWLWLSPEKSVPGLEYFPELAFYLANMPPLSSGAKQEIHNECKKWEAFRIQKPFVYPEGFVLQILFFWRLINTDTFELSNLQFLLGTLALGKRLEARMQSAWLQQQLNSDQTFFSMLRQTQTVLSKLVTPQIEAYFSYRLLQDAILAEIFINWYLKPENPNQCQGVFAGKQFMLDIPYSQSKGVIKA